jgi:hypothetical protein
MMYNAPMTIPPTTTAKLRPGNLVIPPPTLIAALELVADAVDPVATINSLKDVIPLPVTAVIATLVAVLSTPTAPLVTVLNPATAPLVTLPNPPTAAEVAVSNPPTAAEVAVPKTPTAPDVTVLNTPTAPDVAVSKAPPRTDVASPATPSTSERNPCPWTSAKVPSNTSVGVKCMLE